MCKLISLDFFIAHLLKTKKKTEKQERITKAKLFFVAFTSFSGVAWPSFVSHCAFWSKINHIVSCEIHLGRHYHYMHILKFRTQFPSTQWNITLFKTEKKKTTNTHTRTRTHFSASFALICLFSFLMLLYFNCLCDLVKIGHIFCSFYFTKNKYN